MSADPFVADLIAAFDPVVVFERAFGLAPHEWQYGYLHETRPTIVNKGRQVGASLAAAALAIHQAVYRPGTLALIVGPSQKQSGEIATRARMGLRRLGVRLAQDSATVLRLDNGSRIVSLPGSARSIRTYSADLLVLDEAAYLEHATIVAARPLIAATAGRLLMQSTPAGQYGDFYETWQSEDPSWARFTVPSASVSTISAEFLASERRQMGRDAFAAEYECTFGRVGSTLFTADRLAQWLLPKKEEE